MRLDEVSAEAVYLKVSGSHRAGGLNSGRYRVKSMEKVDGGYDVGITSWTDGLIFVPERTTRELMFTNKQRMPITPTMAYSMLHVQESGEVYDKKDFDANDPEILVHGYGRLTLSQIKNQIKNKLLAMTEMSIDNIDYELNNGILKTLVQAVKDAEAELSSPQMKRKITMRNKQ